MSQCQIDRIRVSNQIQVTFTMQVADEHEDFLEQSNTRPTTFRRPVQLRFVDAQLAARVCNHGADFAYWGAYAICSSEYREGFIVEGSRGSPTALGGGVVTLLCLGDRVGAGGTCGGMTRTANSWVMRGSPWPDSDATAAASPARGPCQSATRLMRQYNAGGSLPG